MSGSEKNEINLNVGSGLFSMTCDSIPSGVLDVELSGYVNGIDDGLSAVSPEVGVGTPGVSPGS